MRQAMLRSAYQCGALGPLSTVALRDYASSEKAVWLRDGVKFLAPQPTTACRSVRLGYIDMSVHRVFAAASALGFMYFERARVAYRTNGRLAILDL